MDLDLAKKEMVAVNGTEDVIRWLIR